MNSMQMPQQPQPMQGAGLGAMLQTKGSSSGVSKQSMNQMMARARDLPDSELADVLAGKSMAVPQFAAMLAAMGRQSLRTAVAGAQAGQAKQPSEKDKLLANMQGGQAAGLAAVPAPNMDNLGEGMAAGGIVAFSGDNQSAVTDPDVPKRQWGPELTPAARWLRELRNRPFSAVGPRLFAPPSPNENIDASLGQPNYTPELASPNENIDASLPGPKATPAGTGPARTGAGAPKTGLDALATARAEAPTGRKSPIDDLLASTDEIRKQVASGKEQAQGEFLMTLGARIMRTPNLGAAIGQGIQEGLPGLAANRKEANMLLKDQRDYNLNLSKAKEAAAQGRDDLAFKYADLAEKAQYHAGVIGVGMARAGGSGGSEKLAQQLNIAATNMTNKQWEAYVRAQGVRGSRLTEADAAAFFKRNFPSNLSMMQGSMPTMSDPRVVSEIPKGGNILSRD